MNKYIFIIAIIIIGLSALVVNGAGFGGGNGGTSIGGSSSFYVSATSSSSTGNAATTTPCAVQSPTNATSTLIDGTFNITQSTSTAGTITISKASTAFATTTVLATSTLSANVLQTKSALATTTYTVHDGRLFREDLIFSPGDWLVVGVAGNSGGFRLSASCEAVFNSVN